MAHDVSSCPTAHSPALAPTDWACQVVHCGAIVEFGVGAGWSKTKPSLAAFDEGGTLAETEWGDDWSIYDALRWLENELCNGELAEHCMAAAEFTEDDVKPASAYSAGEGRFDDSRLPHLAKWIRKLRPARYAQIGQRPTEPFLSLHKGNPRFGGPKKDKLVWSYPRRVGTLTEVLTRLDAGAATVK
jgi:hypothetical protein